MAPAEGFPGLLERNRAELIKGRGQGAGQTQQGRLGKQVSRKAFQA